MTDSTVKHARNNTVTLRAKLIRQRPSHLRCYDTLAILGAGCTKSQSEYGSITVDSSVWLIAVTILWTLLWLYLCPSEGSTYPHVQV